MGEAHKGRDILDADRDVLQFRFACGAGIAGGDKHLLDQGGLCSLPGQGMFAAAADDQNLHWY